jgi:hypothetical protein
VQAEAEPRLIRSFELDDWNQIRAAYDEPRNPCSGRRGTRQRWSPRRRRVRQPLQSRDDAVVAHSARANGEPPASVRRGCHGGGERDWLVASVAVRGGRQALRPHEPAEQPREPHHPPHEITTHRHRQGANGDREVDGCGHLAERVARNGEVAAPDPALRVRPTPAAMVWNSPGEEVPPCSAVTGPR